MKCEICEYEYSIPFVEILSKHRCSCGKYSKVCYECICSKNLLCKSCKRNLKINIIIDEDS